MSTDGEVGTIPTTCKTWRCKGCRDRILNLFKARVNIGCSILGKCAFITGTYQAESPRLGRAGCVREDWKALWRRMPPDLKSLKWLRVMELTKKGIPHWHLVAGTIGENQEARCWGDYLVEKTYRKRFDTCECLAHRFAREWFGVTGDSYIVHGTDVYSARGAGGYMAKYLLKGFDGERARALGMRRRWSTSKGWPGSGHMELDVDGWLVRNFQYGKGREAEDTDTFTRKGSASQAYIVA